MGRFVGIHTVPGFTTAMLERTTHRVGRMSHARFVPAYSSFAGGKVVYGLPYDEIVSVEAISEAGEAGVDTRYL
jgi:hypothetical protein